MVVPTDYCIIESYLSNVANEQEVELEAMRKPSGCGVSTLLMSVAGCDIDVIPSRLTYISSPLV